MSYVKRNSETDFLARMLMIQFTHYTYTWILANRLPPTPSLFSYTNILQICAHNARGAKITDSRVLFMEQCKILSRILVASHIVCKQEFQIRRKVKYATYTSVFFGKSSFRKGLAVLGSRLSALASPSAVNSPETNKI